MSTAVLKLTPTQPDFVPAEEARQEARRFLASMLPASRAVAAKVFDSIEFVDAGENFRRVSCPNCGKEIDGAWWSEAMSEAHAARFRRLEVAVPCCGAEISLNDLNYDFPQGFARFVLQAIDPNVAALDSEATGMLERILGCPLRVIWAHY